MAQWIKALALGPYNLSSIPRTMWWKDRTHPKLSSYLHVSAMALTHPYRKVES